MTRNQKLERWANQELPRHVDAMILEQDGQYLVWGEYLLEPSKHGCPVWIKNQLVHVFANKRVAMSWCTASKYRQRRLADQIIELDITRHDLISEIQQRQTNIQRSQRPEFKDLVTVKLQPTQDKLASTVSELEKCINLAKYLQLKGFNNETLRTSNT
jgi:hypothetical protein